MKRIVRGICFDSTSIPLPQRKLLLIYEHGNWRFPGGHCEGEGNDGEGANPALVREFKEETGLDVRVGALVYTLQIPDLSALQSPDRSGNKTLFFEVRPVGGELIQTMMAQGVSPAWFPVSELGKIKMSKYWRYTAKRILSYLRRKETFRG
ncbi:MAG: NUDIX domain-containing protein [bacterium]|nr:NUDIX domain-containing protein [bacterium]